jgi:nicotinate-nucleotide adenylyltransferase
MQIGLFFGSFNPVHAGHLILANYMAEYTPLEEVWMVVSPHNPLKDKASLLHQQKRLNLVDVAIEPYSAIRSSNIEFTLPLPSYTVNTLAHLKEKYPQHTFSLIMGQDNLATLHKWKNYEVILQHHKIYVYPRHGVEAGPLDEHPAIILTEAPIIEISSTFLRQAIKEGKEVRYFFPPGVWEELEASGYYR